MEFLFNINPLKFGIVWLKRIVPCGCPPSERPYSTPKRQCALVFTSSPMRIFAKMLASTPALDLHFKGAGRCGGGSRGALECPGHPGSHSSPRLAGAEWSKASGSTPCTCTWERPATETPHLSFLGLKQRFRERLQVAVKEGEHLCRTHTVLFMRFSQNVG